MKPVIPGLAGELTKAGLLGADQALVLLQEQRATGKPLETLIVSFGFLETQILHAFLEDQNKVRLYDPEIHHVDPLLTESFGYHEALRHKTLPLFQEGDTLHGVFVDVHDVIAQDALKKAFPQCTRVTAYLIRPDAFQEKLDHVYDQRVDLSFFLESLSHDSSHAKSGAQRFLDALFLRAVRERASDIHMEPDQFFVRVRNRVDGVLRQTVIFHKDHWSAVCVCLKIMAGLNIAQTRQPQGGRFHYVVAGRPVDFRVSIHPTQHGENIVLRLLDRLYGLMPLKDLGFCDRQVDILKSVLKSSDGLILLTGPTGAGKTTTLYSMLAHLDAQARNIMTLEEPIEYSLKGLRQSEIKDLGGVRFGEGVRSLLRQDPDVIFIGEIRDEETASMALRASMTGHLVLSTLHTNDTLSVVQRLKDLGVPAHLIEGNLLCLVAQRLLRRLCPECMESSAQGNTPKGCTACHWTGYKGRFAIAEVLPLTLDLEHKMVQGHAKSALLQDLQAKGFETLWDRGLGHVRSGATSYQELCRVVRRHGWESAPADLQQNEKGYRRAEG
ncbi:MAG: GspE/PulE family protein [Alphaproteobacteria bacterium]|jgi:type II secretory ATPase GspE/PulE/Tfp pilus assembly ATPase PilB-like protein|nr:GspE/PulE family protein [Alphaproteobacteria bacterium]